MSAQPDLFNWTPPAKPPQPLRALARSSDPPTSHAAAADLAHFLTELEADVLRVIVRAGAFGATLDEIVDGTGLDKVTASPRLKPLERKGCVRRHGTRVGKARKQQTIWVVA